MSIKLLKEVTVWQKCGYTVPQHIYAFEDNKWVGYITSNGNYHVFGKPYFFDKRDRKFKDVTNEYSRIVN